jgi:ADP-heptose:LPS heptosyltransferase
LPDDLKLFGLLVAIYNPKTTDERLPNTGTTCHLVDDLGASCGLTITARQPLLYPSASLIKKTRIAYGLPRARTGNRLIIGINGGPSWPVRTWDVAKWQTLINKIHAEYDAVIIQFGTNKGDGSSEYDKLVGVQFVGSQIKSEALVALIAICDLLISIDSGPVHLAGTVGTPVIGLFGSVNPSYRLPPDSPAVGLFSEVPCLFCHHKTRLGHWHTGCPNGILCMKKLDDQTVFEAVKYFIADGRTATAPALAGATRAT